MTRTFNIPRQRRYPMRPTHNPSILASRWREYITGDTSTFTVDAVRKILVSEPTEADR